MEPELEDLSGELAVKKIQQKNIAEAKKKSVEIGLFFKKSSYTSGRSAPDDATAIAIQSMLDMGVEDISPYVRIKIRPEDIGKLAELALGNGEKHLPAHIDFRNEGAKALDDGTIYCSAIIEIE